MCITRAFGALRYALHLRDSDRGARMSFLRDCFKPSASVQPKPISPATELHEVFALYSVEGRMDVAHFHQFLSTVQHESSLSELQAQAVMETWYRAAQNQPPSVLDFHEQNFMDYLFDTKNNLAINTLMHHEMTRPLSHYFVFTGHNSYLTGNQLNSTCSEKPIAESLCQGVRVVELDLWPSSDKSGVLVFHGRTLTSPVEFEKCLVAIRDNAFVKSPYPVIVTLEDHLTPELQEKAAKTITDIFGQALFCPESIDGLKEFPSPESLKGRILISTKPPKEYLGPKTSQLPKVLEGKILAEGEKEIKSIWGHEISSLSTNEHAKDGARVGEDDDGESSGEDLTCPQMREYLVSLEYKKIIAIRQSGKPKGKPLVEALEIGENAKRISLSETQLSKVVEKNPISVIKFTHRNFLRIFPYGLRIDSSNYNPIEAWVHGAQMVAVNMQGYGRHLWAAQGFFKANGGCGYVRKPNFLLPEYSGPYLNVFDPEMPVKQILKVKVCKGRGWLEQFGKQKFDTFSPPDFYVRVGIASVKADSIMKKTATMDDQWTPEWGEEFEFGLRLPELALLRVEVHEEDKAGRDDFAGQTCVPFSELKPGYRVLPLHDERGNELERVSLLFHFQFK